MLSQTSSKSNQQPANHHVEQIPALLIDLPNWVVFRTYPKPDGRLGKTPLVPGTDRHASISDPATWRTFAVALADATARGLSLGIAITTDVNITLIDIDGQRDHPLIASLDSYTERSVSGTGIHILVQGHPPANAIKPPGTEVYPGNRFLLITGELIDGRGTIEDRAAQLATLFPARVAPPTPPPSLSHEDEDILRRARAAKNASQFANLFDRGDTSAYGHDHSRADQALCSLISFWTQDPGQIDRLFRQSALMREKWDRADYRDRTIGKALQRDTFYTPSEAQAWSPADPCGDVRDELAELRAALADERSRRLRAEESLSAIAQTVLNPNLSHSDKVIAVATAVEVVAKRARGEVTEDGDVALNPSSLANDHRPKPAKGDHILPFNPVDGSLPRMPRSSARTALDTAIERGLIAAEKRPAIRTRANGSTYEDWDYLVTPATSLADMLNPWAHYRPEQPKVRKVRESRACQHCGEMHPITQIDYCGGCGGKMAQRTIQPPTDMGEKTSPIGGVVVERLIGRKNFSHSPEEPAWLADAPDRGIQEDDRDHAAATFLFSPEPSRSYHFDIGD
jgi:hypothetical protein